MQVSFGGKHQHQRTNQCIDRNFLSVSMLRMIIVAVSCISTDSFVDFFLGLYRRRRFRFCSPCFMQCIKYSLPLLYQFSNKTQPNQTQLDRVTILNNVMLNTIRPQKLKMTSYGFLMYIKLTTYFNTRPHVAPKQREFNR